MRNDEGERETGEEGRGDGEKGRGEREGREGGRGGRGIYPSICEIEKATFNSNLPNTVTPSKVAAKSEELIP